MSPMDAYKIETSDCRFNAAKKADACNAISDSAKPVVVQECREDAAESLRRCLAQVDRKYSDYFRNGDYPGDPRRFNYNPLGPRSSPY